MTDAERKEIGATIHAQIAGIKDTLAALKESSRPVAPDNAIGRLTRMDAINAKHISEASLENSMVRLARLENSFKRLDLEDFGVCSVCEEDIPFKRLLLVPESMRCVHCMDD